MLNLFKVLLTIEQIESLFYLIIQLVIFPLVMTYNFQAIILTLSKHHLLLNVLNNVPPTKI